VYILLKVSVVRQAESGSVEGSAPPLTHPDDPPSWIDIQIVTLATAHGLLVACGTATWATAEGAAAKPHQPASLWLRASVRERRRYLVFVECALRVRLSFPLVATYYLSCDTAATTCNSCIDRQHAVISSAATIIRTAAPEMTGQKGAASTRISLHGCYMIMCQQPVKGSGRLLPRGLYLSGRRQGRC
jgi:hypothetical protein